MCTVEFRLVGEVARRRPAALAPLRPLPPRNVCRRLFSEAPRPTEFLKALQQKMEKENAEKWNFDFRNEKPLPGRFDWVRVGGLAPPDLEKGQTQQRTPAKSYPTQSNSQATQSRITDFLQQRKRKVEVSSSSSSPKLKCRR